MYCSCISRPLLFHVNGGRTHDPIDYVNKHIPNIFMAESYLYPVKYDRRKRIKAGALSVKLSSINPRSFASRPPEAEIGIQCKVN